MKLKNLKSLNFTGNADLKIIGQIPTLEALTLRYSPDTDLTRIENLTELKELSLLDCENLNDIDALYNFDKLEFLELSCDIPEDKANELYNHFSEIRLRIDTMTKSFESKKYTDWKNQSDEN